MKNKELIEMYEGLTKSGEVSHFGLNYAISKNMKKMKSIIGPIQEMKDKILPGQISFDEDRIELCKEHAEKDKDGKPLLRLNTIAKRNEFVILDMKKYEVELNKLKDTSKHIEYATARCKLDSEIDILMNEEVEKINWHMVKYSDIPAALNISKHVIDLIDPFITEE